MALGLNQNTITSANSIVLLRCKGVYDNWVSAEGAQADAFVSFDDVTLAQTVMGVDGKLSFGWTPHTTGTTISLQANSASVNVFETIYNDSLNNREARLIELQISYPSVKRKQTISGTLVSKSGGTGISTLLDGHTYRLEGISGGIEEIN